MPDIKIFVSHRIDINSELIDNPLYVPVRCGAVFDDENPMGILGDGTGDNISERRMSFCEFTVQYWAWKNEEADYYGLCHYRRYLSFANKLYPVSRKDGTVHQALLTERVKRKFGLVSQEKMENFVSDYDIIVAKKVPVSTLVTPVGAKHTVREMWQGYHGQFLDSEYLTMLLDLIADLAPQYYTAAQNYLSGNAFWGHNCYVMKKALFHELCEFEFSILFALENKVDLRRHPRAIGYLGEILYGIFVRHIFDTQKWSARELQLLFICDPKKITGRVNVMARHLKQFAKRILEMIVDLFLPRGSLRRATVKKWARA